MTATNCVQFFFFFFFFFSGIGPPLSNLIHEFDHVITHKKGNINTAKQLPYWIAIHK